jgi:hypothetical protein
VLPLLEALVEAQPRAPGRTDSKGLGVALASLRPLLQPGSLVLVLSDFSGLDSVAETALAAASLYHDCRLLWITDPLESAGLPDGSYHVGLPGKRWWLDGERSRPAWQQAWAAREQRLGELADRLNLPLSRLATVDAIGDSLPALLRASA